MKLTKFIETLFQRFLPSPFTIAILLTLLTLLLAWIGTEPKGTDSHILTILSFWESGIWSNDLLVFAYQMMLILVLGHILVLSTPVNKFIQWLTKAVHNTQSAVVLVSVSTMLVSFFNWGLGLIFGAIMARKVGEIAQERGFPINYPLVGASGYVGLMIWHGGISGSAPSKVSESGHLMSIMEGIDNPQLANQIPELISYSDTVFGIPNLILFGILLISVPIFLNYLAKNSSATSLQLPIYRNSISKEEENKRLFRLDHLKYFGWGFGLLIIIAFFYQYHDSLANLIITPNMLNFFMLGLALILHGSFSNFLQAVEEAIKGTSGILIQFPLYFGIMGIMKGTGMVTDISHFFVSIATETTLPIFTFISAGLVNIFVPSGGGQWAIQGPVVIESAIQLGIPLNKAIMALAYGDQLTNMLQPFWALPLLGITRLKAKEILPYTLLLLFLGATVFIIGLLLW